MVRVEKLNAVYDIEEKDLQNWIAKGYKKVVKTSDPILDEEETEDEEPKAKRRRN